jgi:cytochrome c-type biogenesis protein
MAAGVLIHLGILRFRCCRAGAFGAGEAGRTIAAYVLGLAFAFGWTPCIGPVLGPILTGRRPRTVGEGGCCSPPIRSASASRS